MENMGAVVRAVRQWQSERFAQYDGRGKASRIRVKADTEMSAMQERWRQKARKYNFFRPIHSRRLRLKSLRS